MKNKILKVLIISYLSFFVGSFAMAADCSWTKQTKYPGIMPEKSIIGCSSGNDISADTKCTTTKPDGGVTNPGAISGQISYACCCPTPVAAAEPKFKMPDFTFQTPIPGLAKLSTINCTDTCQIPWISEYIFAIYTYGLTVVGVIAVLILMAAGLLWIVSGGDSGKITQAKGMIAGSVTGLLLLVSMNLLLSYINPDLIQKKPIVLEVVKDVVMSDDDVVSSSETPYSAECEASRRGDYTLCQAAADKNVKPANLVTVEGKEVNSTFAEYYNKAMECVAQKNNGKALFKINQSWRSPAKQIEYYNIYLREGKPLAAKPCCSNHGSGQAVDVNRVDGASMSWSVNDSSGLTACMNANSLYANLSNEPWHWSLTGK